MLQGFHWTSHQVKKPSWYDIIKENAERIKDSGFTLVWFPPPSDSVNPQGYEPRILNELNTAYGDESELKNAVEALQPEIKILAPYISQKKKNSDIKTGKI